MNRILLISPATTDMAVLEAALRASSFEVVSVRSINEARLALARGSFAVALVDLLVRDDAGSTALELSREIRVDFPSTRVVLTSAYDLSEQQLARTGCGVCGFLARPFEVGAAVAFLQAKADRGGPFALGAPRSPHDAKLDRSPAPPGTRRPTPPPSRHRPFEDKA